MSVKCFLLEETTKVRRQLCRTHAGCNNYTCVTFDYEEAPVKTSIGPYEPNNFSGPWPEACGCGYVFTDVDRKSVKPGRMLRRTDTGEEMTWREAPPGAMFDAWWAHEWCLGLDGKCLVVKCPPDGHDWYVDSQARNCDKKDDKIHKCWCRHGEPPSVTVDKNGVTCGAGAGSIQTPTWHGFLRNGELVE